MPSHVLVALDGSPLADDALVHALETFDCRVTVLNVVDPIDRSMSESGVLDVDETRRADALDFAADAVERARRRTGATDQRVETAVETGEPAATILEYVDDHGVDHVVIGGHGGERSELASRLLGTIVTSVVTEAPVTTTVVR